ncbi:glycosyltransferase family 2 protein [Flavobacterium frigoris]|uniref:Glycosyl transferase, group 2 family n=1 Tax=Flavobacterium frigoris (strain PS1) TaxID=1086011 RepID=H7FM72_FLAFP|nr:glycosyltransferase family 2 protein [Flavobacterium frigoris]EIA10410.1 glycosyl transferase, group 2 family [Flavobacterium frigoris PS1]
MMEEINPVISFVSPVYMAEKIVDKLVVEIQKVMITINQPYEIILVDDRSPDKSWEKMKAIANKFSEVKSVRLSRNFGQHPTIMAGLSMAKGEWIVVMDCDLQDQPKEVVKLFNKAKEGFDVVLAKRKNRQDGFFKKTSSFIFSKIYGYFTDTNYDNEIANFGIYHNKVIKSILEISDSIKFFPLFIKFVGYNSTSIIVEHAKREEGNSSYNYIKLVSLAFNSIISFSNKPLKLFVKFGLMISAISFMFGLYNIYLTLTNQIDVLGYSSIIVSIWFLSGIIITTTGVTGIYVGKIFDQTKNRPVFIIDEIR